MVCLSCSTTTATGETVIACEGFCAGSYHAKCVGLSADEKITCIKNPHVFWICTTCSTMLREIRYSEDMQMKFKSLASSTPAARRTEQQNDNTEPVSICKSTDTIAEIKTEIAAIQKTLADLTASHQSVLSTTTNERPLAHSSPTSPHNSSHAGRSGHRIGAIPRQIGNDYYSANYNEKFWLFFSRVKNDVSAEEIRSMVAECLGNSNSIVVQKLVSNWMDPALLPYISFKVGVDANLREQAMRPSTWPNGVWFREFKEKCYTWQPQAR